MNENNEHLIDELISKLEREAEELTIQLEEEDALNSMTTAQRDELAWFVALNKHKTE